MLAAVKFGGLHPVRYLQTMHLHRRQRGLTAHDRDDCMLVLLGLHRDHDRRRLDDDRLDLLGG